MQNLLIIRQALYRFFSHLFLYPDEENLNDMCVAANELLNSQESWGEQPYAEKLSVLLEQLSEVNIEDRKWIEDEYNRLFLIKPLVPPYETTYLKSMGKSDGMVVATVSGIYAQAGLAISPSFNDMPDHVAIELEFMSFLCEKELQALSEGDEESVSDMQQGQYEFMGKHLAQWYPHFAEKALSEAKKNLYKNVVGASTAFLRKELELLGIRQKDKTHG